MKILHINYSDKSGGAGIAAYRHNEAMNRIGLNSNMLVVLKMTRDNTIYVLRKNRVQLQVLDNLYNFLHSFVIRRFKPRAVFNNLSIPCILNVEAFIQCKYIASACCTKGCLSTLCPNRA